MKNKMKHLFLSAMMIACCFAATAQNGSLVADSSKSTRDTLRGSIVWLDKDDKLQTGKGYSVRVIAPLVFKGEGNVSAATDKITVLSVKIYANKNEIAPEDVVFFRAQPKNK